MFQTFDLRQFDLATTNTVNGTAIHPFTILPSSAGNSSRYRQSSEWRSLYQSRTGGTGVRRLNRSTGAIITTGFGTGTNGIGITVDPQTGNLVYATGSGFRSVNPAPVTTETVFSTVGPPERLSRRRLRWHCFRSDWKFSFRRRSSQQCSLTIIRRDGTLVGESQWLVGPMVSRSMPPAPKFVLVNMNDGTIQRLDFPNDDYEQVPNRYYICKRWIPEATWHV